MSAMTLILRTGPAARLGALLLLVGPLVDVRAGIEWNIGLFERWAIYPIMVGYALFGATVLVRQPARALDEQDEPALLVW
ncbi:hypothetical protein [Promicromonospora panici]|uniref:hypothetical protein n=1 Tax=Promicromonospora panici TaxID=2219658 RepID=UPI00101D2CFF|nr:hypothetical protein [Promicromonospora panici]